MDGEERLTTGGDGWIDEARQEVRAGVGQFKFFEVFMAAESRLIPQSGGSCHLAAGAAGVLGSDASERRPPLAVQGARGPQSASIGQQGGPGC